MESPSHISPDKLTDQVAWVRALAGELAGDVHRAEDLAQETMISALGSGPRDPSKLRAWSAAVMRNLLRQERRGADRQARREAWAARDESTEPVDTVVERAALHGELVAAVLALDEPYRTCILSRYFDDLPPREIAARLGVPTATVKSRLKRGLSRLREGFRSERGREWRTWVLGVLPAAPAVPLPPPIPLAPSLTTPIALVNSKVLLSTVVLAAAGIITYVATKTSAPESGLPRPGVPVVRMETPAARSESLGEERPPPPVRREAQGGAQAVHPVPSNAIEADALQPGGGAWSLRGRVLATEAQPLAGVQLRIKGEQGLFLSGAGGGFLVETNLDRGRVVPTEKKWVAVHEASFRRGDSIEPTVVLAPALSVEGRVVDGGGGAIPFAHVALVLPETLDTVFGSALDASRRPSWSATADHAGRFEFARMPRVAEARLHVTAEGYGRTIVPQPAYDDRGLTVVLIQPAVLLEGSLQGRVLDQEGRPARLARVALGLASVVTDRSGEFRIDLKRAVTADRILAVKEGFGPAVLERPFEPAGDESGWPDYVELILGGPTLAIAGTVLTPDGNPVARVKVWLADPTHFGVLGMMPTTVENLSAGARIPPETFSRRAPQEDNPDQVHGFHTRAGEPNALWNWVSTDVEGRFRLDGLASRPYRLRVLDSESLSQALSDPIDAGELRAEIELPVERLHARLSGRVLTDSGRPIAGVDVRLERESFATRARFFGGVTELGIVDARETVKTDAEGRFQFRRVPVEGMRFSLGSEAIIPMDVELTSEPDLEDYTIVADARCHLQVSLANSGWVADGVSAHTEEGERIPLSLIREDSTTSRSIYPLAEGKTPVLSVSSRARSLWFLQGDIVVHEVPLDLLPGEVTQVRPR